MSLARRVADRLWHLAVSLAGWVLAWPITQLVKLGEWIERKKLERAVRKENPR